MKMEGETTLLKTNLNEWRFSLYPKYILLPIDENHDQVKNNVKNIVYSEVPPRPLERNIRLVCASDNVLTNILDMDPNIVNNPDFVEFLAGRKLPYGALPVAHRYGGHQYGLWVGQLGDGRAHIIGEYVNRLNERWQVQLKGSGQTPYSRVYDGRAVLRSCIREMIASEAMFYLGVPTTRTAAVVVSDECVVRDQYYSPRYRSPRRERAAVLLRLSQSWFRFGSLEILAKSEELAVLMQVTDFVIKEYFPDINVTDENKYIRLFSEIAHRTLDLVAKWQGLGFTHGLLNTDNMSLLGVTLDYGPFAFVDSYDSGFVANSSDGEGRYALGKQSNIAVWNITQLANALEPLMTTSQQVHISHILKTLDSYCKNKILETFLMKIGLKKERWGDEELVEKLLDMMQHTGADFTATFRQLAELEPCDMVSELKLKEKWSLKRLSSHSSWGCWLEQYRERLDKEAVDTSSSVGFFEGERRRRMLSVNPVYIPRNWLIHEAVLDAERDDFEKLRFLLNVIQNPYEVQPEAELRGFSSQPPQWAYTLKISCSS